MSLEDLGKKTSVSSVTISNIEKGMYSPKLTTVLEIAKALGSTILHLVEGVDEPRVFKIEKTASAWNPQKESSFMISVL